MNIDTKEPIVGNYDKKMYCGLETFKIVDVNPSRKKLNEILGIEPKEDLQEIEYLSETKEGDDKIKISLVLESRQRFLIKNFYIVDKNRNNKEGDKLQYINQTCNTTWVDKEENLPEFFINFIDKNKNNIGKKEYRVAKEGEAEFYEFIKSIGVGINWYSQSTNFEFNFKKLLKEDFSQLKTILLNDVHFPEFTALTYVKTVVVEEGVKKYNEIFTKGVIPSYLLKGIFATCNKHYNSLLNEIKEDDKLYDSLNINKEILREALTQDDIYGYVDSPNFKFTKDFEQKAFDRLLKEIEGEYGCKGFYKLSPVFEYNDKMETDFSDKSISSSGSDY